MKKTIAGSLFAAALCLSACGGSPPDMSGVAQQKSTVKASPNGTATGVTCSNKEWRDIFWSDATYTVQVGSLSCPQCYGPEILDGQESNFITLDYEFTCDFN
jgi:hypothetical protein